MVPLDIPFPTEVARGRPEKAIMARAPTKPGPKDMPVAAKRMQHRSTQQGYQNQMQGEKNAIFGRFVNRQTRA